MQLSTVVNSIARRAALRALGQAAHAGRASSQLHPKPSPDRAPKFPVHLSLAPSHPSLYDFTNQPIPRCGAYTIRCGILYFPGRSTRSG